MMDITIIIHKLIERLDIVEEQYLEAIEFASGTGMGTGYIDIKYRTIFESMNSILDVVDVVQAETTQDRKQDESEG